MGEEVKPLLEADEPAADVVALQITHQPLLAGAVQQQGKQDELTEHAQVDSVSTALQQAMARAEAAEAEAARQAMLRKEAEDRAAALQEAKDREAGQEAGGTTAAALQEANGTAAQQALVLKKGGNRHVPKTREQMHRMQKALEADDQQVKTSVVADAVQDRQQQLRQLRAGELSGNETIAELYTTLWAVLDKSNSGSLQLDELTRLNGG